MTSHPLIKVPALAWTALFLMMTLINQYVLMARTAIGQSMVYLDKLFSPSPSNIHYVITFNSLFRTPND